MISPVIAGRNNEFIDILEENDVTRDSGHHSRIPLPNISWAPVSYKLTKQDTDRRLPGQEGNSPALIDGCLTTLEVGVKVVSSCLFSASEAKRHPTIQGQRVRLHHYCTLATAAWSFAGCSAAPFVNRTECHFSRIDLNQNEFHRRHPSRADFPADSSP